MAEVDLDEAVGDSGLVCALRRAVASRSIGYALAQLAHPQHADTVVAIEIAKGHGVVFEVPAQSQRRAARGAVHALDVEQALGLGKVVFAE
jgi:hypothetical protein